MAAVRNTLVTLSGGGEPERLPAQMATVNLFSTLGINVTEGRTFSPEEDKAGGPNVVLISYSLWQRTLGYTLRLTVVGAVIGIAAAFVLTRYVSAFLFQVPSYDLITLGGAAIVIVLVAIAASYLPARRATSIDPAKALRQN